MVEREREMLNQSPFITHSCHPQQPTDKDKEKKTDNNNTKYKSKEETWKKDTKNEETETEKQREHLPILPRSTLNTTDGATVEPVDAIRRQTHRTRQ